MRIIVTISGNLTSTQQNEYAVMQTEAEADTANASTSLALVNPRVAQYLDKLPSGAVDASKGLASVLSNLEGIIKIADLLADVSEYCCIFAFICL